ncbi:MAG: hypothetical protein KZQ78_06425 [Candidatus Thiodiazotropha sp. (ex Ustalcina ferruginea)]|nr:hypothetical protein [Candidatus Thiodiazotropha sp. (ex Ustalcina ferruginea)]
MRWLLLLILLAGCSQSYLVSDDLGYPYNLPPVGSQLLLKQSVMIQPGTTRTFIQQGVSMALSEFDRYVPNCNFEISNLADSSLRIEPDTFVVKKVQRVMEQVVYQQMTGRGNITVSYEDPGSSLITLGYHLWLDSARQPDVMRLTCRGAFNDRWGADPPSIREVREALGDFAELILAI